MSLLPSQRAHFKPARNWMNDPNGLIYFDGLYHLFFQYNPEDDQWGNMSWGHATSTDLITWQELPVAISYTPTHGIFSGSAVVDYFGTSGFGRGAMVAIFTDHKHDGSHQSQSLAYSVDEGATWTRYEANPVLDLSMKEFRDPKVSWNLVNDAWVMSVVKPEEHTVCFYQSDDLKKWELLSEFTNKNGTDGPWECPDLFPLAIDGDSKKTKWILFVSVNPGGVTGGSGTQYFIGDWNGKEFIADDRDLRWLDYGRDNYAGVTFNNAPDSRRIYIGWMNNWDYARTLPANPSRGMMTVARKLSLTIMDNQITLLQNPVADFSSDEVKDFKFTIEPSASKSGIRCVRTDGSFVEVGYDADEKFIYIDRSKIWFDVASSHIHKTHLDLQGKPCEIRVVLGTSSIEIFVDRGQIALTDLLLPGELPVVITPFTTN